MSDSFEPDIDPQSWASAEIERLTADYAIGVAISNKKLLAQHLGVLDRIAEFEAVVVAAKELLRQHNDMDDTYKEFELLDRALAKLRLWEVAHESPPYKADLLERIAEIEAELDNDARLKGIYRDDIKRLTAENKQLRDRQQAKALGGSS